jgi:hypothetical protein
MPLYLSRVSYTPETRARLIGNPEDRREAARSHLESSVGSSMGSGTPSHTTASPSGKLPTTCRWPRLR